MTYTSNMASAEFNIKPQTESFITPFAGFRWVQLDERLTQSDTIAGPLLPTFNIDTQNDLYGLQLGADILLVDTDRFELLATGKFAVAGNAARNRIQTLPINGPGILPQIASGSASISMITDLALKGKVKLTDNIAMTAGYSVIFLSKVALAPAQLEQNQTFMGAIFPNPGFTTPNGHNHLEVGDTLIYHGGKVELELVW